MVFRPSVGTNIAMDAAAEVTGQTGGVASCISAYDGDLWSHLLFDRGSLRDRFCSRADYFQEIAYPGSDAIASLAIELEAGGDTKLEPDARWAM